MRTRSKSKLLLVLVVSLFLVLLLGAGVLYQREDRNQAGLETRIGQLAPVLQKPAPDTAAAQAGVDNLQSRIAAAQAVFPGTDESIEVVRSLETLAASWGVSMVRQSAVPGSKTVGRFEFPVTDFNLTLEGQEQNLLNFIAELDKELATARIDLVAFAAKGAQTARPSMEVKFAVYAQGQEAIAGK